MHFLLKFKESVPGRFLSVFRVLFISLLIVEIGLYYFKYNYFGDYYLIPSFHFKFYGFSWVPDLSASGVQVLLFSLVVSLVMVLLGFKTRLFSFLSFLQFGWVFLMESAGYLNHWYFYWGILFLLSIIESDSHFAIKAKNRSSQILLWNYSVLIIYIVFMYLYSGIVKINEDWLSGQTLKNYFDWFLPEAHQTLKSSSFFDSFFTFISWYIIFLEIIVTLFLLNRKLRYFALALYSTFHLGNSYLLRIGTFPYVSLLCTLLVVGFVGLKSSAVSDNTNLKIGEPALFYKIVLILFFIVQMILPLRIYTVGDYVWAGKDRTYFAWNMFLVLPKGVLKFRATDINNTKEVMVDPRDYGISDRQYFSMLHNSDMQLQFASYIKERFQDEFKSYDSFHSINVVSVNGKEEAFYVNPHVNLWAEKRSFLGFPSIVEPLNEGLNALDVKNIFEQ